MKSKILGLFSILLLISVSLVWLRFCWSANLQMSDGWWILFMDERLYFDAIYSILNSNGLADLWSNLIGPDMRYGRAAFYLPAALSGSGIFGSGETSIIVTNRIFLSVAQSLGFSLIGYVCFRSLWGALFGLVLGLTSPYAAYYSTMPKPEPLLILAIGTFLLLHFKGMMRPKWLVLGFAVGLKISILPFSIVFALTEHLKGRLSKRALVSFGLGFLLNVPALVELRFREYLWWIKANVRHGSDSPDVGPFDWISLVGVEYLGNETLGYIWICLVLALMIWITFPYLKDRKQICALLDNESHLVLILGASFLFPVIISVKRLWGLYLHIGYFLLVTGALMTVMTSIRSKRSSPQKYLAGAIVVLSLVLAPFRIEENFNRLAIASDRNSQPAYITELERKKFVQTLLSQVPWTTAVITGYLPYDKYALMPRELDHMWGPFTDWKKGYDLIFNIASACEESEGPIPQDSNASACEKGRELRRRHLAANESNVCLEAPCYEILQSPPGLKTYRKVNP